MAAVISFGIGYLLGTRAGENGLEELKSSWRTIAGSPEMRRLATSAMSIARDLVFQGRGVLADRINPGTGTPLRSVA